MEAIVLKNIPFQLDAEALRERLHIRKGTAFVDELKRLVDEAQDIGRPKALYGAAYIESRDGDRVVVDGVTLASRVLSVNLENVKLGEFLRYISRNYDLQFQVGDELVWVSDMKDPKKIMEETRFYRLRKGFILPAQFGNEDVTRQTVTVGAVQTMTETQKFKKFVNDETPALPALEKAITNLFTGSKPKDTP